MLGTDRAESPTTKASVLALLFAEYAPSYCINVLLALVVAVWVTKARVDSKGCHIDGEREPETTRIDKIVIGGAVVDKGGNNCQVKQCELRGLKGCQFFILG